MTSPRPALPRRLLFAGAAHTLGLGGRILSTLLRLVGRYRLLDQAERADAELVFGSSAIDLDAVRLPERGVLTALVWRLAGRRAFTTMHTIHHHPDVKLPRRVLIHELVHVWQGERFGHRYMLEALWAQWFGEGYAVDDTHLQRWQGDFARANREQQAVLVERYWAIRHDANRRAEHWRPYEPFARAVRVDGGP